VIVDDVQAWVERYVVAWRSNDPDDIAALFTDDATYSTGPFDEIVSGRDAIVQSWIKNKDEPGTWNFDFQVLAIADDLGIVTGRTDYSAPERHYANLWLIRLDDDGRARAYAEWWMTPGDN
jgi:uncharacterized protein (TIGR02246 family)